MLCVYLTKYLLHVSHMNAPCTSPAVYLFWGLWCSLCTPLHSQIHTPSSTRCHCGYASPSNLPCTPFCTIPCRVPQWLCGWLLAEQHDLTPGPPPLHPLAQGQWLSWCCLHGAAGQGSRNVAVRYTGGRYKRIGGAEGSFGRLFFCELFFY